MYSKKILVICVSVKLYNYRTQYQFLSLLTVFFLCKIYMYSTQRTPVPATSNCSPFHCFKVESMTDWAGTSVRGWKSTHVLDLPPCLACVQQLRLHCHPVGYIPRGPLRPVYTNRHQFTQGQTSLTSHHILFLVIKLLRELTHGQSR